MNTPRRPSPPPLRSSAERRRGDPAWSGWVRRTAGAAAGLALACGVSACVQIPSGGPVVPVSGESGQASPIEAPYTQPRPPQKGDTPEEIVQGFLNAMTAVPVQATAARAFLTKDAGTRWSPRGVVIYDPPTTPRGIAAVSVRLRGGHVLGPRGNWRGRLPHAQSRLTLPMRLEGTEYRISRVPDALYVTQPYFEQNYERVSLDFFDPTGHVLVPELVYLPNGDQLATALVRGLLSGPSTSDAGVSRTFIPPGLTATQLSVPVVKRVAEIGLKGPDPSLLSPKTTQLMLTQFAATLSQDPSIGAFTVTIGGRPVTDAGDTTFRTTGEGAFDNGAYDPAIPKASSILYAISGGLLVSGTARSQGEIGGRFGTEPLGVRSFGVSLDGTRVAAATRDSILVGPTQTNAEPVPVLSGATGLLRPSFDFAGRIWDIETGASGAAKVICVRHQRVRTVRVPGITGQPVHRFLVSRDGSRLVAVLSGRKADRIVVSRLRYDSSGRPVGATRARSIPWGRAGGSPRVRDIGWTSPTTIAVLHLLNQGFSEVRTVAVDGSTIASESQGNLIAGRVTGLVTSPTGASQTSYAVQPGTLADLSQVNPLPSVSFSKVHGFTYAG